MDIKTDHVTTIGNCARCGGDHRDLKFTPLTQPQEEWSHWALCPTNSEPIMLAFVDDPAKE